MLKFRLNLTATDDNGKVAASDFDITISEQAAHGVDLSPQGAIDTVICKLIEDGSGISVDPV